MSKYLESIFANRGPPQTLGREHELTSTVWHLSDIMLKNHNAASPERQH